MKANSAREAAKLTHIPNIGPATVKDLRLLGITTPQQLKGKNGLELYRKLNEVSGVHHDPCMADVFMSAVDFMNGGKPKPWWAFTKMRKKLLEREQK